MTNPDALLLIATGCAHCPKSLESLATLVKEGVIGRLEVINISDRPEIASELGVRSVPWTRIGQYELFGLKPLSEYREWAERSITGGNMAQYLAELISTERLSEAMSAVVDDSTLLHDLVDLMSDHETTMSVRIGISAIIEEIAEKPNALKEIVPSLCALTGAPEPYIRADACHFLALSEDPSAISYVEALLEDPDPEVREIAAESLPILKSAQN